MNYHRPEGCEAEVSDMWDSGNQEARSVRVRLSCGDSQIELACGYIPQVFGSGNERTAIASLERQVSEQLGGMCVDCLGCEVASE